MKLSVPVSIQNFYKIRQKWIRNVKIDLLVLLPIVNKIQYNVCKFSFENLKDKKPNYCFFKQKNKQTDISNYRVASLLKIFEVSIF